MVYSSLFLASALLATAIEEEGSSLLQMNKRSAKTGKEDTVEEGVTRDVGWCIKKCITEDKHECDSCLSEVIITPDLQTSNGIGVDYLIGMLGLSGKSYSESFCDGQVEGCAIKEEFPGKRVTSIMGHEAVSNLTRLTPEMEWSGEWWRGNELGFIINNPLFWMESGINPPNIGLGSTPRQHAVVRPYIEELFTVDTWTKKAKREAFGTVDQMIRDFLEERKASGSTITVPTDLTILVHQILNKVSLKRDLAWQDAADFVELQGKVVALGLIGEAIPASLYQDCEKQSWWNPNRAICTMLRKELLKITDQVKGYVDQYQEALRGSVEERIAARDAECAPSESCLRQLAAGTFDALYAAGGLSVPTNIAVGLGVLFSEHESNPFKGRKDTFVPDENAVEFAWEVARYFPAVVGFPHWEVRPTCEGMTAEETQNLAAPDGATQPCPWDKDGKDGKPKTVNQYQGGQRIVPNLALAQRDPAVWGSDADEFIIRSHTEYTKSVGFAEPAWRPEFVGGAMNRNCPGKTLALHISSSFFKQLKRSEWQVADAEMNDGTGPKITPGPKFVEGFELKPSV